MKKLSIFVLAVAVPLLLFSCKGKEEIDKGPKYQYSEVEKLIIDRLRKDIQNQGIDPNVVIKSGKLEIINEQCRESMGRTQCYYGGYYPIFVKFGADYKDKEVEFKKGETVESRIYFEIYVEKVHYAGNYNVSKPNILGIPVHGTPGEDKNEAEYTNKIENKQPFG